VEAEAVEEEVVAVAGKIAGIALLLLGFAIGGFLGSGLSEGKLQISGFMLGIILFVLPFLGGGVYVFWRGSQEARESLRVRREKEILSMIETQGRAKIPDICLTLKLDRPSVETLVRDLVGKGLFMGSINWKEGVLISAEAKEAGEGRCPHCGGELQMAGKGLIRCRFCGSEIYR
jgi:hypothetical protein